VWDVAIAEPSLLVRPAAHRVIRGPGYRNLAEAFALSVGTGGQQHGDDPCLRVRECPQDYDPPKLLRPSTVSKSRGPRRSARLKDGAS
jgi:hypothetical protein